MENHIKMNDLGMPQFEEAAIELDIYIYITIDMGMDTYIYI
jgi:hypothetical protein